MVAPSRHLVGRHVCGSGVNTAVAKFDSTGYVAVFSYSRYGVSTARLHFHSDSEK